MRIRITIGYRFIEICKSSFTQFFIGKFDGSEYGTYIVYKKIRISSGTIHKKSSICEK